MAIAGAPRVIEDKFAFTVLISGIAVASFNKCSALEWEFDKIEHREGGSLIPVVKDPGLLNYSDITLERGAVSNDSDLYDWIEEVADAATNTGLEQPLFKRSFDIRVRKRNGAVEKFWRLTNAWPVKFVGGDWDADASEKTIEMVTLTFDTAKRRLQ